ncbi:MAG: protein translocase subunit SecF [Candidatus Pacebacteria bacterium]|nr:protein translocase subunit SecF [Candidatus Paceibacterota bacterium]MDD5357427.1 protein translocase subunit SecF [Candidatus Paceibacterota bacterium]
MWVVNHRKILFAIIGTLIVLSLLSFFGWGLHFGIEYTGGSLLEVNYPGGRPDTTVVQSELAPLNLGNYLLQPTGDSSYVLKTGELSETQHEAVKNALSQGGKVTIEEKNFTSIGPVVGSELKRKAIIAIVLVILCIVLFIAFAFRKVSEPVSSWKYGVVAVITLMHDIAIPAGVYGLLVHFHGAQIDILFTTALLAVLGISINDTIVVFDRIRENLRLNREGRGKEPFDQIVGRSLKQTYLRSFNTSFTVILVLFSLFLLGGETTKNFALTLLVGMVAGTYSSIFFASPLLVTLWKAQDKK